MSTIEEVREQARETLIATRKLVHEVLEQSRTLPLDVQSAQVMLVLLDAGYSKGPRPITDEMVEAAAEALRPGLFTGSLAQYERRYDNYGADVRATHQESVLEDVRAALEAAEEARR